MRCSGVSHLPFRSVPMAERKKPRQDGKLLGLSAMSFGNAASAILSFFRFAQITAIFGANWQTDALAVAMVFPYW